MTWTQGQRTWAGWEVRAGGLVERAEKPKYGAALDICRLCVLGQVLSPSLCISVFLCKWRSSTWFPKSFPIVAFGKSILTTPTGEALWRHFTFWSWASLDPWPPTLKATPLGFPCSKCGYETQFQPQECKQKCYRNFQELSLTDILYKSSWSPPPSCQSSWDKEKKLAKGVK